MLHQSLGLADFVLRFLTATRQHCLRQIHNIVMILAVPIVLHLFRQNKSPLQKLFWTSRVIYFDLHCVSLGLLVFMVNGDL
jgi:hypothetical protein